MRITPYRPTDEQIRREWVGEGRKKPAAPAYVPPGQEAVDSVRWRVTSRPTLLTRLVRMLVGR